MVCLSDTNSKVTSSFKLPKKDRQRSSSINKSKVIPQHFDESCTQHKSIELNACDFKLFAEPLFTLRPLKLKQLIIRNPILPVYPWIFCADTYSEKDCSHFFSQLARHPDFTMEILEIAEVDLGKVKSSDFDLLLTKKTLQIVRLIQCTGINTTAIHKVTTKHKFSIEEKIDTRKISTSGKKARQVRTKILHLFTVTLTKCTVY